MDSPLQISYHSMESSPSIEAFIREKAAKLEKFCQRITTCRVFVDGPDHDRKHGSAYHGKLYHVRIELAVPGEELVVNRNPVLHATHTDVYAAISDAFKSARRMLEDYVRRVRGDVKHHESPEAVTEELGEAEET